LIDRVAAGWSLSAAAEAAGISERTARKWLARYRAEGPEGLLDRSGAAHTIANRTDEGHPQGDGRRGTQPSSPRETRRSQNIHG